MRNDQRRRRVVIDEAINSGETSATIAFQLPDDRVTIPDNQSVRSQTNAYNPSANRRHHLKTSDLLPKRPRALVLWGIALVALLAGLNAISYCWGTLEIQGTGGRTLTPFRLTGTGTLSSWFSTVLFMASCLASLQIYALRQHRRSDYLGTYRIWILFAAICLFASIYCLVDLDSLLLVGSRKLIASPGVATLAVVLVKLTALCAIFVRGVIEVRGSKSAIVVVSLAWLLYIVSQIMQIPEARPEYVRDYDLQYGNSILVANVLVLTSLIVYGRYVFLVAHGLLTAPEAKAKVTKTKHPKTPKVKAKPKKSLDEETSASNPSAVPESADRNNKSTRDNEATENAVKPAANPTKVGSAPLASRVSKSANSKPSAPDETEAASEQTLSKAERKRLKKLQKQQTRDRRAA
ncbi:MAG: hypothetical protein R3C03_19310 [Pirellulaceae bacterium]